AGEATARAAATAAHGTLAHGVAAAPASHTAAEMLRGRDRDTGDERRRRGRGQHRFHPRAPHANLTLLDRDCQLASFRKVLGRDSSDKKISDLFERDGLLGADYLHREYLFTLR